MKNLKQKLFSISVPFDQEIFHIRWKTFLQKLQTDFRLEVAFSMSASSNWNNETKICKFLILTTA